MIKQWSLFGAQLRVEPQCEAQNDSEKGPKRIYAKEKKTVFLINQLDVTLSASQVFQKFLSNYKSLPELWVALG